MDEKITRQEYLSIHNWLRYHHGKADSCEFCGVSDKKITWALEKGKQHKRDISHYIGLCYSCHQKYDMTESERGKHK